MNATVGWIIGIAFIIGTVLLFPGGSGEPKDYRPGFEEIRRVR